MSFGGFGSSAPAFGSTQGGLGGSPSSNPFASSTATQGRPAFGGFGTGTATPTATGWGTQQTLGGGATGGGFGFGTPATGTSPTAPSIFGGTGASTTGAAQTFQQQQQQLELQQRRFWENEFDLLRDSYTPQTGMMTPGSVMQQRTTDYKFPFRVIDQSTGVAREVLLTDHKSIEMKLQSQRADMERIEKHIVTLRQSVQGLQDQARGAKDRLEQCRDNSTRLTRRFLLVLQKIHVMHNINRPFDARDKGLRDRLEDMIGRLEDAVRVLNDVTAVVDEQDADMREHQRQEITCSLAPENLELLQQSLEKQQEVLDFLTKTLRRDMKGTDVLRAHLDTARPTLA